MVHDDDSGERDWMEGVRDTLMIGHCSGKLEGMRNRVKLTG